MRKTKVMSNLLIAITDRINRKYKYKDNYNGYSLTNKKIANEYYNRTIGERQKYQKMFEDSKILENQVEEQIKKKNPTFSKKAFLSLSKEYFIKLQKAWTERDIETIKILETSQLFKQHKKQLQEYIDNNAINVLEKINVKTVTLHEYKQINEKNFITVKLNAKMNDYIIDATTKEVIKGNKYTEIDIIYYLTFVSTGKIDGISWKLSSFERVN